MAEGDREHADSRTWWLLARILVVAGATVAGTWLVTAQEHAHASNPDNAQSTTDHFVDGLPLPELDSVKLLDPPPAAANETVAALTEPVTGTLHDLGEVLRPVGEGAGGTLDMATKAEVEGDDTVGSPAEQPKGPLRPSRAPMPASPPVAEPPRILPLVTNEEVINGPVDVRVASGFAESDPPPVPDLPTFPERAHPPVVPNPLSGAPGCGSDGNQGTTQSFGLCSHDRAALPLDLSASGPYRRGALPLTGVSGPRPETTPD